MSLRKQLLGGVVAGLAAVTAGIFAGHALGIGVGLSRAAVAPPAALPQSNTADGFSALGSIGLPNASTTVIADLQSLHPGSYLTARQVTPGITIAENNGAVCMWVQSGLGGCTDHLNAGNAWLAGDMIREYDSETAPFEVHLYGLARDSVSSFAFTLSNGSVVTAPVSNDAFSVTMSNTGFENVTGITETATDGSTQTLNPADYFPAKAALISP